jgi:Zn-dependent M28 family amino/carboxypeptidase
MIDLDMIGRLNKYKTVNIFGTATSSKWKNLLKLSDNGSLNLVFIKSQVDGSDHIPFYNKGIPVLFFNTGLHSDYHTPADIISRINVSGELEILKFVLKVLNNFNKQEKMDFTETTRWQMISGLRHFIL